MRCEFAVWDERETFSWLVTDPVRFHKGDILVSTYGRFVVDSRPEFHNAGGELEVSYTVVRMKED